MKSWFANIAINRKLGLGFGLVLLFTLALAWTGWSSLNNVIQRSSHMTEIADLNNSLTGLRIARLQFMLAQADEESSARLEQRLEAYLTHQQALLNSFTDAASVAMLQEQNQYNEQYKRALGGMRQAYADVSTAHASVNALTSTLAEHTEAIYSRVIELPEDEESHLAQLQGIALIRDQIQQVRYLYSVYAASGAAQDGAAVLTQLDSAQATVSSYRYALEQDFENDLQAIEEALEQYRPAVQHTQQAIAAIAATRQEMTDLQGDIVRVSEALNQGQRDQMDAQSTHARTQLVLSTLLALLLGVLAAWLITRQITRPLHETMADVERIASGDLTPRGAVTRRDELGVLQQGILQMGLTLRELIGGIRDGVAQISSAAEELSAVTEQTSAGVNSQQIETDQVASAMHEMSATVHEVARNAEQAAEAATEADNEARAGDRVVAEVVAQIELLAAEVMRSTEAMEVLQSESDKIGSVMGVIRAVAEQTNLLALNAAIEAARAGEAGRGFAVVADEVRSLAQRTQNSTSEIEELVAGLQNGTKQVAAFMSSSRELTDSSVELTRKAGGALANITGTVSTIQSMNQQIAAAAEEQSAVAEEISRSVLNVRDASEQTASASNETAASSAELARLGGQLQALVSRFRL